MDGFVKMIPGVSQLIGILNSLIGVYNAWRIFSFGDIDKKIKDSRILNASSLGVLLARFLASKIRSGLGLLNISGIESALKSAYHFDLIAMDYIKKFSLKPDKIDISVVDGFDTKEVNISKSGFDSFFSKIKGFFTSSQGKTKKLKKMKKY